MLGSSGGYTCVADPFSARIDLQRQGLRAQSQVICFETMCLWDDPFGALEASSLARRDEMN